MKAFSSVAMSLGLVCMSSLAFPDLDPAVVTRLTSSQLRKAYLDCEFASSHHRISAEAMAYCGLVGDVLQHRDFGGDLDRLLAWWRGARRGPDSSVVCKPERRAS